MSKKNKKNWVRLTDPRKVNARCTFTADKRTQSFSQFILVGFHENGETLVTAADLRDLAKGIQMLQEVYDNAMEQVTPDVRRSVEVDIFLEGALRGEEDDDDE